MQQNEHTKKSIELFFIKIMIRFGTATVLQLLLKWSRPGCVHVEKSVEGQISSSYCYIRSLGSHNHVLNGIEILPGVEVYHIDPKHTPDDINKESLNQQNLSGSLHLDEKKSKATDLPFHCRSIAFESTDHREIVDVAEVCHGVGAWRIAHFSLECYGVGTCLKKVWNEKTAMC